MSDIHSILYRGKNPLQQTFEAQHDPTKRTLRHRAGEAPVLPKVEEKPRQAPKVVNDVKMARLAARAAAAKTQGAKKRRVVVNQPSDIPLGGEAAEALADEEESAERKKRMREMALKNREEEERLLAQVLDSSDDEENDLSAAEDDDIYHSHLPSRPVFISKGKRITEKVREEQSLEEQKEIDREIKKVKETEEQLKLHISKLVEEESEENTKDAASDTEMPDDTDDIDPEMDYNLWKLRQLQRIKRDKEEKLASDQYAAEIERRRNMTDAEREESDKLLDAKYPALAEKRSYLFMQKYFHKGAFFQDKAATGEEPLYLRDFNEPVAGDLVDKSGAPRPLQLRRGQFGKAGRVKHTHLSATDTTDFTYGWSKKEKPPLPTADGDKEPEKT